jgi:hypothetical protein
VGKACDAGIALRKAVSSGMAALKPKMEALPGLMKTGDTKETFSALKATLELANRTYQNASAFNPYYQYFFGNYMADDADCGFDPGDVKAIADAISPVIQTQYIGQGANATALAQEASLRKDYSRIRGLQVKGEEAAESLRGSVAEAKARFAGYGFPADAFDAKIMKADRILADLESAGSAADAERQLNSLFNAVAETNAMKEKYAILLPLYSEMLSNVRQADALISEARTTDPGRADAMQKDLDELRRQITLANDALRKGEEIDAASIEKLNSQAAALKAGAGGESLQAFDWFPVVAIAIIAAGAFAVYWFKIRRRGYY